MIATAWPKNRLVRRLLGVLNDEMAIQGQQLPPIGQAHKM
jgi:hypothetical protein